MNQAHQDLSSIHPEMAELSSLNIDSIARFKAGLQRGQSAQDPYVRVVCRDRYYR